MLQIKNISKKYVTGDLTQIALDDVSLNLRDNEFVAILGPSGSGKTTLLNIIGGLDRYDSGDLVINGISTKKYSDRDWDSYRNHTIGFVFQSYNLIPHQTVLANVEMALTISGIGGAERKKRAIEALEKVGLGNQLHKRPNQMSGGQMQRVAIARALVNDPDILLADEPTGALDTETSVQVMDLLKEVANDRLVVMVTHNPELAEEYATRIVRVKDGHIMDDSMPFDVAEEELTEPEHKNMGKSSMSFLTALSLSFNNLLTKKARTILTSFAGSIGIIGIALILAISNGVDVYINNLESETLSEYPLSITKDDMDLMSLFTEASEEYSTNASTKDDYEVVESQTIGKLLAKTTTNDLRSLKEYFDSGESGIEDYTKAVEYSYNITPYIFKLSDDEKEYRKINPDTTFSGSSSGMDFISIAMTMSASSSYFSALPQNEELYKNQYDVCEGRWPENYNECVLVLTENGAVTDTLLYAVGLKDADELDAYMEAYNNDEEVVIDEEVSYYNYSDFIGIEMKLVDAYEFYEYDDEYDIYVDKSDNEEYMLDKVKNGETLTIVGVVQPTDDTVAAMLTSGIAYPAELEQHIMERAEKSEIVKKQIADPDINIFTGKEFDDEDTSFDLESLFSVDEDAISDMFDFDTDSLSLDESSLEDMDLSSLSDSMDLSSLSDSMDLSSLSDSMDLSSLTGSMDLSSILSSIDLSSLNVEVSQEELVNLFGSIVSGYLAQAADDPSTDYSKLGDAMAGYLTSSDAIDIITEHMREILEKVSAAMPTREELEALTTDVVNGLADYITAQDPENAEEVANAISEYLNGGTVQAKIDAYNAELQERINNIDVGADDAAALAGDLYNGYESYAAENSLPQTSKMLSSFLSYLQTDEAMTLISDGVSKVVDLDALQTQLGSVLTNAMSGLTDGISSSMSTMMTSVMTSLMSSLSSVLGDSLTSSITDMMSSVMDQITDSMTDAFSFDSDSLADMVDIGTGSGECRRSRKRDIRIP